MKKFTALLALSLLSLPFAAFAEREVKDYSETIEMFKRNDVAGPMMEKAYGYAVFPVIGKGGIGIGGSYGEGQVYRNGEVTGFTSLADVSVGFQLGGQAYSQIILFRDEAAYDNFTDGNFEFDATASAVALTASVQAKAGTAGGATASAGVGGSAGAQAENLDWHKGTMVFTIAKGGLMYQAAIAGQKYSFKPVE